MLNNKTKNNARQGLYSGLPLPATLGHHSPGWPVTSATCTEANLSTWLVPGMQYSLTLSCTLSHQCQGLAYIYIYKYKLFIFP